MAQVSVSWKKRILYQTKIIQPINQQYKMRTSYLIYIAMMTGLWLSACSEYEARFPEKEAEDISLRAVVDEVETVSRSSNDGAYTGTVPSAQNVLEAAVWFSLEPGSYLNSPQGETNLPVHTRIDYKSGTATFPTGADESSKPKYPTNAETPVYCVGFYPYTGWDNPSNGNVIDYTKATHTIKGTEDLMFAPQISGNLNRKFETQRFRHLLTWLKVCVCAASSEAGSYWGDLQQVILKDVPQRLTIDLAKTEGDDFELDKTVDYSLTDPNNIVDYLILNSSDGIALEITPQEVGSIFCHPQSEYKLDIICANGKATDVTIKLQALKTDDTEVDEENKAKLKYPAGLQYVLTLYFHPFNVVEGVCTLNAWNAQNEDLYPNVTQQ